MTYILASEGKKIIGDSIHTYSSGELTFIGADLPHVWHNDIANLDPSQEARSIALYFDPQELLGICSKLFDSTALVTFLEHSRRGLLFKGETKEILIQKLQVMVRTAGIQKALLLFEIIAILMQTKEYEFLSNPNYVNRYDFKDNSKIERVFKYVFDNFRKEILLDQVAELCTMTKHSFCRYFKSRTQKTFIQFLNEVRISESCKLIRENRDQISSIAYSCGYHSLSYFNKSFKIIKGLTPREYKAKFANLKTSL